MNSVEIQTIVIKSPFFQLKSVDKTENSLLE